MISSAVFWVVYLAVLALTVIVTVFYLLKAVAICDLSAAYNRPWLAFVPVLRGFAAGRAASGGKSGLGIFAAFVYGLKSVVCVGVAGLFGAKFCGIVAEADRLLTDGRDVPKDIFHSMNNLLIYLWIALVVILVAHVVSLICTYRILGRVAPKRAAVCLVVSFFLPFLEPLFLFGVRHNGGER